LIYRVNMRRKPWAIEESILRIVEHLACHLAERSQGWITPYHLTPYLPLSLELIRTCLDDLLDGESVVSPAGEEKVVYQFPAYRDLQPQPGVLSLESCVACGVRLPAKTLSVLCMPCAETLHSDGGRIAKEHGWATQALLEHALLYAAAPYAGQPVSVTTLASRAHSRMRATRHTL
jgi:hypothetical protein